MEFLTGRRTVQFFVMRAGFSGREGHWACGRQTQQAFLEAQVAAFTYVGGVFARRRDDTLGLAVKQLWRGRRREETVRFIARRSHSVFAADFCRPGLAGAHEKGGVEGTVGRFRRHPRGPVPVMADLAAFHDYLRAACEADGARRITGRDQAVARDWQQEQGALRPLPATPGSTAEVLTCRVDSSSRLRVRTHPYSLPVALVEPTVEVHLHAQQLEVFYRGRRVASHPRLPGRFGARLRLDPYLERLPVKPGALVNARARHQARESGQWPAQDDRLFAELKPRYGDTHGTRQRRPVLLLHRDHEAGAVHQAVVQALALGCRDAGALAVLGRPQGAAPAPPVGVTDLGALARYGQTWPASLHSYDGLRPSQAVEVSPGDASARA